MTKLIVKLKKSERKLVFMDSHNRLKFGQQYVEEMCTYVLTYMQKLCSQKEYFVRVLWESSVMLQNLINIYELISVCPSVRNMGVFSETAYSSQTKLIGQSLCISEHGIGYLNLAFAANKGKKGQYSVLSPWNA